MVWRVVLCAFSRQRCSRWSLGVHIRLVCRLVRSSFSVKFKLQIYNSFDTMSEVARHFFLCKTSTFYMLWIVGHSISINHCARNFDSCEVELSFLPIFLAELFRLYLAFSKHFSHSSSKIRRPLLVCLLKSFFSVFFLTTHGAPIVSIVRSSSTTWQFLWLNGQNGP